jgi:hypothetical protein
MGHCNVFVSDFGHCACLLRLHCERPYHRPADQPYELAPSHCLLQGYAKSIFRALLSTRQRSG